VSAWVCESGMMGGVREGVCHTHTTHTRSTFMPAVSRECVCSVSVYVSVGERGWGSPVCVRERESMCVREKVQV